MLGQVMIAECAKAMVEKIAELKLSPPFVFGRVISTVPGKEDERFFIGLCSREAMEAHCYRIQQQDYLG